jgi:hypothetical protein
MKLKREIAVAFLVSLGFAAAGGWDVAKITDRLVKVPDKVKDDDVADEHKELYAELVEAEGVVEIIEGVSKTAPRTATGEVDLNELDKKGLMTVIEEEGFEIPGAKKMGSLELIKRITKLRSNKPAAAPAKSSKALVTEKPAAKAKEIKEPKPAKEPKPVKAKIPRDKFGCAEGSISAAVNATLTKEWKDEVAIIEEAGVSKDQARGRLYYGAESGVFEYRRLLQYRIAPAGEVSEKQAKPAKK